MVEHDEQKQRTREVLADSKAQWAVVFDLVDRLNDAIDVLKEQEQQHGDDR